MPLIQGKSKEAFSKNVGKEMDAGKPRAQSLAIAYNMKRRMAQKKAKGGMIDREEVNRPHVDREMYAEGGMAGGSTTEMRKNQIANAFKAHGGTMRRYAEGGIVENEDLDPRYEPEHDAEDSMMKEHRFSKFAEEHDEIDEPRESRGHYSEASEDTPHGMLGDIAGSIMKKRMMAEGGTVSQNDDFLSDEEQDPFAHENSFDEFKEKPKRRSILDSIMRAR